MYFWFSILCVNQKSTRKNALLKQLYEEEWQRASEDRPRSSFFITPERLYLMAIKELIDTYKALRTAVGVKGGEWRMILEVTRTPPVV